MRLLTLLSVFYVLPVEHVAAADGPVLKFRPESYAVHNMHTHHLSAQLHARVLQAYSGDAASIPKEDLENHVKAIQRQVTAARKSLNSVPEEMQKNKDAAKDVKGIKQSHAQATKSLKAISEKLQKDQPDYKQVQEHANRVVQALNTGEGHIHAVHNHWQLSPIHRRLHPGD